MEIQMGGVFELWNPEGRGGLSSFWNSGGRGGGKKTVPSAVEVWIFSGITQCLRNLWFSTFQVCYFSSMLRCRNERSDAQRCFSWNQEGGKGGTVNCKRKCKQQTIEIIKLCLSCVLLFLIDFQTRVFGNPNMLFFTEVSRCIHVTEMPGCNWFITWWIVSLRTKDKCQLDFAQSLFFLSPSNETSKWPHAWLKSQIWRNKSLKSQCTVKGITTRIENNSEDRRDERM